MIEIPLPALIIGGLILVLVGIEVGWRDGWKCGFDEARRLCEDANGRRD